MNECEPFFNIAYKKYLNTSPLVKRLKSANCNKSSPKQNLNIAYTFKEVDEIKKTINFLANAKKIRSKSPNEYYKSNETQNYKKLYKKYIDQLNKQRHEIQKEKIENNIKMHKENVCRQLEKSIIEENNLSDINPKKYPRNNKDEDQTKILSVLKTYKKSDLPPKTIIFSNQNTKLSAIRSKTPENKTNNNVSSFSYGNVDSTIEGNRKKFPLSPFSRKFIQRTEEGVTLLLPGIKRISSAHKKK